jgi:phage shock protein PspC (stress-responsive transcriptional regulator)
MVYLIGIKMNDQQIFCILLVIFFSAFFCAIFIYLITSISFNKKQNNIYKQINDLEKEIDEVLKK